MNVRSAAVAGSFYPSASDELRAMLDQNFQAARQSPAAIALGGDRTPKVIVVPHAGYIYSGAIAASAYRLLRPAAKKIRNVILLGPAHRVPVRGVAIPEADAFATPLGELRIDPVLVALAERLPWVKFDDAPHAEEHSLEVHLPFLQTVLEDFTILPVVVGDAKPNEVASLLNALWGGEETLIVISSDLSHFLTYSEAVRVDEKTLKRLLAADDTLDGADACGSAPLNGLSRIARTHRLRPILLDARNSADTAGDRKRVVGYAALAYYESHD